MKIHLCLLYIMLFSVFSCSTTSLREEFENKSSVYKAANEGDTTKLKAILDKAGEITEYDRFDILYASLLGGCYPEVVKIVFDYKGEFFKEEISQKQNSFSSRFSSAWTGKSLEKRHKIIRPGARLVNIALTNYCPEALDLISKKVSSDDFSIGVSDKQERIALYWDIENKYGRTTYPSFLEEITGLVDSQSWSKLEDANVLKTIQFVRVKLNELCSEKGSVSCKVKDSFDDFKDSTAKKLAAIEYEQSEAGQLESVTDEACHSYRQYKIRLALIKEENEKGKVSGFVNKYNLKTWGDSAYEFKKAYDRYNSERKKLKKTKRNVHDDYQCDP